MAPFTKKGRLKYHQPQLKPFLKSFNVLNQEVEEVLSDFDLGLGRVNLEILQCNAFSFGHVCSCFY